MISLRTIFWRGVAAMPTGIVLVTITVGLMVITE